MSLERLRAHADIANLIWWFYMENEKKEQGCICETPECGAPLPPESYIIRHKTADAVSVMLVCRQCHNDYYSQGE